jgi:hypothetical protein
MQQSDMNQFRIISSFEADLVKYDACIAADPASTPFVESWYLNITAESWFIITDKNLETVFPFAARSRFGIQYIYQPFFNRCTGIYGNDKPGIARAIQQGMLNDFRLWDFYADGSITGTDAASQQKKYQSLKLNSSYDYIYEHYSAKLKRNLRLAEKDGVAVRVSSDLHNFDGEFRKYTGERINEFKTPDYITLKNLATATINHKQGMLLEAVHNSRITAAALFYEGPDSILYIEGYSNPEGRALRSMHVLFDHVIKMFAASGKRLDFGGSNLETVARFFHSFGAEDIHYDHLYRNRLPLLVSWLKKNRK